VSGPKRFFRSGREEGGEAHASVRGMGDPVIAWDAEGVPVLFSASARALVPAAPRSVPREQWADHYGVRRPDGTPFLSAADLPLFRALAGEEVHDEQLLIASGGAGPDRLVSVDAAPMRDANGEMSGAVTVMRDITEAERAPPRAELLAGIVEHMPYSVCLVRASDGTIVYANPQWALMFGYAAGEGPGVHLSAVSAGPDEAVPGERVREVVQRLAEYGSWSGRVEQVRKDGARFWSDETIWAFEDERAGRVWAIVYGERSQR
jgi:PAS domain S-box-containing protein